MAYTVSEVSICNQAMVELGANTFSSRTEQNSEAIACNNVFDNLRRELISSHPWNFAMKQVELAESASTPVLQFDHQFAVPSDRLRLWKVLDDGNYRDMENLILTDKTTCKIVYIFDNTDVTTWPPYFISLFVAALVAKLAYPITESGAQSERAHAVFEKKFQTAKTINATEDIQNTYGQFDSLLLNSRYSD